MDLGLFLIYCDIKIKKFFAFELKIFALLIINTLYLVFGIWYLVFGIGCFVLGVRRGICWEVVELGESYPLPAGAGLSALSCKVSAGSRASLGAYRLGFAVDCRIHGQPAALPLFPLHAI